jgi:hypothetical protein
MRISVFFMSPPDKTAKRFVIQSMTIRSFSLPGDSGTEKPGAKIHVRANLHVKFGERSNLQQGCLLSRVSGHELLTIREVDGSIEIKYAC